METGNVDTATAESDFVVEGTVRVGGQEHFYLETNCAIVVPLENGDLSVVSSTQNPAEVQKYCAKACGIPSSRVVSSVKRMGGGFGGDYLKHSILSINYSICYILGKESRSVIFSAPAAVAAYILRKAVKINIERGM